jgi:DNA-binding transcriptional LysR family regulator
MVERALRGGLISVAPADNLGRAMNDRALRYFLAVVRTGSIRGAAEVLNVSASAISRLVAELEAECGETLLDRLPRGVTPTEAGRIVAEHAQRQADEAALLDDRLRRLRGAQQGMVRLCCGAGFIGDLMDNGIASFAESHPGITFKVSLSTTDGILAAVAESRADIGLAYNPPAHLEVRAAIISRQPLSAILPVAHPLARAPRPVSLRMFAGEPVTLLPPDHGIRQMLSRVEADGGFRLASRLETGSFELQRRFVSVGMGVAFLPDFVVAAELQAGLLAAVPLTDPLLSEAATHLIVRAGRRLPEAVNVMLGWLAEQLLALRRSVR